MNTNIKETPTLLDGVKTLIILPLLLIGFPLCMIFASYMAIHGLFFQLFLFTAAWIASIVMIRGVEEFMNFRFYGTELSEKEIINEKSGITAANGYTLQKKYPELTKIRLSTKMSKNEKRRAVNAIAVPVCFDRTFKICLAVFALCSAGWLFYPAPSGAADSGAVMPIVTDIVGEFSNLPEFETLFK